MARVLACLFPRPADAESASHYDACSAVQDLASLAAAGVQVKLLVDPTFADFQQARKDLSPTLVYVSGRSHYEQNTATGLVGPLHFTDGPPPVEALAETCTGVETVYLDCSGQEGIAGKLQAAGVQAVISWPDQTPVPAVHASQFSHTFFSALLILQASVGEAFALASHTMQALCPPPALPLGADGVLPPAPPQLVLPLLHAPYKAALPDNSSIPAPSIPGLDPAVPLATSVQGWADIRLLAPRAELRLLLTGSPALIDGSRLSFLGEALRALLVLEMRGLTLLSSSPCSRTPANLPLGCTALRCELRTTSGAEVVAILGGQPSVLSEAPLVAHALRMTLVADSLSLQFRLPPPEVPAPVARHSAAIAGGVPVVDALVLTSVWAVHVLRSLSLVGTYRPLISLGIAAVGSTATLGVSALDAQRLNMVVSGQGPSTNPFAPILTPGSMPLPAAGGHADAAAAVAAAAAAAAAGDGISAGA